MPPCPQVSQTPLEESMAEQEPTAEQLAQIAAENEEDEHSVNYKPPAQKSIQEIQELINPGLEGIGVLATLHDTRVTDDREILGLLKEEYNLLGVVKRLAVAKKGIYDGLAVVEQAPNSEIAAEYKAVAEMIISGKMKWEEQSHG